MSRQHRDELDRLAWQGDPPPEALDADREAADDAAYRADMAAEDVPAWPTPEEVAEYEEWNRTHGRAR